MGCSLFLAPCDRIKAGLYVFPSDCYTDVVRLSFHHNVYVVLLDPRVLREKKVLKANPKRDPSKPCLYVGMTGILPTVRFQNHKAGHKASRYVEKYGVKLLPEMYEHLNRCHSTQPVRWKRSLLKNCAKRATRFVGECSALGLIMITVPSAPPALVGLAPLRRTACAGPPISACATSHASAGRPDRNRMVRLPAKASPRRRRLLTP